MTQNSPKCLGWLGKSMPDGFTPDPNECPKCSLMTECIVETDNRDKAEMKMKDMEMWPHG